MNDYDYDNLEVKEEIIKEVKEEIIKEVKEEFNYLIDCLRKGNNPHDSLWLDVKKTIDMLIMENT